MPIPAAHQPPKVIPQTTPPAPTASDFNPQPDPPFALKPAPGASMMDTQHSTHGDSYAYSYPSYPAFYDAWVEDMFSPPSPSELSKLKKNEDIPMFEELIRVRLTENEVSGQDRTVNVVDLGTGTGRVVCELFRRLSSSFLKGPQTKQSNTQLRILGVDHSTSMLSTAAENFAKYITPEPHSTLEPPIWIRASASEFLTTLRAASGGVAEGEIDFLFLSVGTIHHLIHPGEVLSFLKELGRGLRAVTGRAVISVLDEMVPDKDEEAKKVDAVKYTKAENQIIKRKGRRGELYVKSPTVTSMENQEVEVDIDDGVRMTVNSEIRCDRWMVEFYDNLPADWEREASSLAQMIAEGMGRKVWTKEMEWSLALWDENVFHKLIHVAGLKVVEVKKGGFQRWYILGKLGKQ